MIEDNIVSGTTTIGYMVAIIALCLIILLLERKYSKKKAQENGVEGKPVASVLSSIFRVIVGFVIAICLAGAIYSYYFYFK